ncbi:uridine kinase family protein [Serinibacter salmoneus]|nr:uridine kinase [Serinibacter salmoneus]
MQQEPPTTAGATASSGATARAGAPREVVTALADRVLTAPARLGPAGERVRLVCLDGYAGAGKTTLAADLARELQPRLAGDGRGGDERAEPGIAVVHMDDLYDGWGGLPGAAQTLRTDLIDPMSRGGSGSYRRYDWHRGRRAERVEVPRRAVVLLEGCGSAPRVLDDVASLIVFVTAPDEVRLARGLARDGESAREHWLAFMADERTVTRRERTLERADVVLDEVGRIVRTSPVAPGVGAE